MSVTLTQLQTRLAYRLGEDSAVSDTNEKARRTQFLNDGYLEVCKEQYFWFMQDIASDTTVSNQEIYDLPSDFRDVIELRVDGNLAMPVYQGKAFSMYSYPSTSTMTQSYFVYGESELHLIPIPSSAPSAKSVSSITRSSTTATVTTSSSHGLSANNYITIAGANETSYNGAFRITSVPSTTTFTYTVTGSPSTPATGTITATERNIVYRYYQYPTLMSSDSDTCLIPDQWVNGIVAYAYGRVCSVDDSRGSAKDGFDEFNQTVNQLSAENMRRKVYGKRVIPDISEPSYYVPERTVE